jgi:hypothetical protein
MKTGTASILLAGAVAVSAAGLNSCRRATPEAAPEPPPVVVATPFPATTPAVATPIAAAPPAQDPLAPPGIFFLLQKTSITTDDGIVGLKPGQSLRQVGPGTYEANGQTVQLRENQVTNNLRIARQFATADAVTQAALRQTLQPTPSVAPITASRSAPPLATPVPRPQPAARNPLSGGPKLGGGTGAADPETSNRRNVRVDSSGRQYWRDSRGNLRYDF